jgi:3-isopropylmalate dehydratase small subunit
MIVRGRALVLGDGISTDAIIAGKYCKMADPEKLAPHALEGVVPDRLPLRGRVLVAGRNFGVGSSREQAPLALKAAGVPAVVAGSFGRIFFRNAVNIGLPVLRCEGAAGAARDGEAVAVDLSSGTLRLGGGRRVLGGERLPSFMMEILVDGGLVPHLGRRFGDGKA